MGGRGAYFSGRSMHYATHEFDRIDSANDGRIKVLKKRENVRHLHFPLYSNTANTTYFVLDENDPGKMATIGIYRKHRIIESIDLTDSRGVHWHEWYTKRTRKGETQAKRNVHHFDMEARHERMIEYARKWETNRT